MDNFYLMDDDDDREWVVPSGALNYQRLVDALDRKGMFPTKTYVACQGVSDGALRSARRIPTPRRRARTSRTSTRRRPLSRSESTGDMHKNHY